MCQKPFLIWNNVVGMSSCCYNLVLGRFLALWEVSLAYIGLCQGSGIGGGSTLRTSPAGVLLFCGTLGSGCCLDLPGVSTLGTCCAGPTGSGAAGFAGAAVGVAFLKMTVRSLSAVVCLSPRCENRAAGAGFWRVSVKSAAADAALSVEEVAGIFMWRGKKSTVLPMRLALVIQIQVQ